MTKRLIAELSDDEHRKVKAAAAAAGWPVGALLLQLVQLWLAGKVKAGPPPGAQTKK
jgi:predicted Rossmann fold nucleotide-binding protein DprA/Smf involved in DNA uptake